MIRVLNALDMSRRRQGNAPKGRVSCDCCAKDEETVRVLDDTIASIPRKCQYDNEMA